MAGTDTFNRRRSGALRRGIGTFAIAALVFGIGCTGSTAVERKSCVSERNKQTVLRWGELYMPNGMVRGYELGGNLVFHKIQKGQANETYTNDSITDLADTTFCRLLVSTVAAFDLVKALNVPAERTRFIEYYNPLSGTTARAIWNPQHQTVGSKEFRALFEEFMAIVPAEAVWHR